eukprot:TRINITY_DN1739_c0_g1_i1.p1 TRINITY_DN1739_c0_g1~~TRINITY_DN1739_c0_g1_i1.p1  ORF type:complete len:202 (+),score=28.49 TRINITY_DN1739_c0_g1_i1:473-1078(+)
MGAAFQPLTALESFHLAGASHPTMAFPSDFFSLPPPALACYAFLYLLQVILWRTLLCCHSAIGFHLRPPVGHPVSLPVSEAWGGEMRFERQRSRNQAKKWSNICRINSLGGGVKERVRGLWEVPGEVRRKGAKFLVQVGGLRGMVRKRPAIYRHGSFGDGTGSSRVQGREGACWRGGGKEWKYCEERKWPRIRHRRDKWPE